MQNNSYTCKNILKVWGDGRASKIKSSNNVFIKPSIKRNPTMKLSLFTRADQPVTLYSIKNILNLTNKLTNLLLYLDQKKF